MDYRLNTLKTNYFPAEWKLMSQQQTWFSNTHSKQLLKDSSFLQANCYVILLQSPWLEAISPLHPSSSSFFFFSFFSPCFSTLFLPSQHCTYSNFPYLHPYINSPQGLLTFLFPNQCFTNSKFSPQYFRIFCILLHLPSILLITDSHFS